MLDLDAIEARAEYKLAHIESQDISLRDITWTLQDVLDLVAELRAAREVVEAAPVAITLRTDEAFYGAMNRLADALAAYRAVGGPE
jgi:hypothetical protein